MKAKKDIRLNKTGKLLQILYPGEFSSFLAYLKIAAIETADDSEELTRVWGKQVLTVGFWISLAQETIKLLRDNENSTPQYTPLLIDRLFKSDQYLFTLYYLVRYIQQPICSETFAFAVRLFFNTKQFSED
ncbi:hypothetical protein SAMN05421820_102637 [Pedobacter steynii]|uniref:Uncharacterized protein n=1 Tax=Pedobacter steynii TaxID=430522 RepID=A0A1G9PFA9_9SPHI|nr:hypothetical protein [Pedobacter steynii]NQX39001.1 hypothetical protein [Pedobacter steynii]SDL97439.1 hypothetical protein SAMN05421820_102637 [Pedobacter steynii]